MNGNEKPPDRLELPDSLMLFGVVLFFSRNMRFGDAAVKTSMYGSPESNYPYGNQLFVYNVETRTSHAFWSHRFPLETPALSMAPTARIAYLLLALNQWST